MNRLALDMGQAKLKKTTFSYRYNQNRDIESKFAYNQNRGLEHAMSKDSMGLLE